MPDHDFKLTRRNALLLGLGSAVAVPLTGTQFANAAVKASTSALRGTKGSKTTLKFASTMPTHTENAHTAWFDAFVKELKTKTDGKVGAIFYGDSQLGPENNYPRQMQFGSIDMMMGPSIWSSIVPEVSVLTMGFLFDSWDQFGHVMDGGAGKTLEAIFKKKAKAEILGWAYNFGARNVIGKRAVTKPADLKGLKLRVLPSPTFVQTFKLLGADPVAMSFGEVYTALQTGTIDGLEHDAPTILQNKFYEVVKELTLTRHIFDPLTPTIAEATLNRLSSDDRKAVRAAATDAVANQRDKATKAAAKAMDELKSRGVKVHDIDRNKLREEVRPLWKSFTKKHPDTKPVLADIRKQTGNG